MVQSHAQPGPAHRHTSPARSLRTFSTREFEAVIRRAAELQAENSARLGGGVSEADMLRIGQELGLDAATIRRAMAEVPSRLAEDTGLLASLAGSRTVRATRIINGPAARVAADLERHLRESELMLPQRRFEHRTTFVRDSSFAANLARFARGFGRPRHRSVDVTRLDVSISAIDDDSCLLELSVDLAGTRGGLVGGVIGGTGGATAAWTAVAWATSLPDPLALVGVPVLAGAWFGTRAIYRTVRRSTLEKIESLLDQVEHDKL